MPGSTHIARAGEDLPSFLAARRHVSLRRLLAPGPDPDALQTMFEAAAQAPDHGVLTPWRFVLISEERRPDLGRAFAAALVERDPLASGAQQAAAHEKAFHAPCLIAAILVDADTAAIPVSEKLVSLGCAIQNLLLAAQALGFGSGLASGNALNAAAMRALLSLACHEKAICFIGVGTGTMAKPPRPRPQPGHFVAVL